jgi:hypothetical protein
MCYIKLSLILFSKLFLFGSFNFSALSTTMQCIPLTVNIKDLRIGLYISMHIAARQSFMILSFLYVLQEDIYRLVLLANPLQ